MLQLNITSLTGTFFEISICKDETIQHLSQKLATLIGCHYQQVRLILFSNVLCNDKKIHDLGLKSGDCLLYQIVSMGFNSTFHDSQFQNKPSNPIILLSSETQNFNFINQIISTLPPDPDDITVLKYSKEVLINLYASLNRPIGWDNAVNELSFLGFPRSDCEHALISSNYNFPLAAQRLLDPDLDQMLDFLLPDPFQIHPHSEIDSLRFQFAQFLFQNDDNNNEQINLTNHVQTQNQDNTPSHFPHLHTTNLTHSTNHSYLRNPHISHEFHHSNQHSPSFRRNINHLRRTQERNSKPVVLRSSNFNQVNIQRPIIN